MLGVIKTMLVFCIGFSILPFFLWQHFQFQTGIVSYFDNASVTDTESFQNKTVILMWSKYYDVSNDKLLSLIFSGRKWDSNCCTGNDLEITVDRNLLPLASVIVFYSYMSNLKKKDLPIRYPGQIWVLFGKESPVHSADLGPYANLFNWTMTYKSNSDIWNPYGYTVTLENPLLPNDTILMPDNIPLSQWVSEKSKLLSGVISHCPTHSRREKFVRLLRNLSLPVDIYGGCGNYKICPRSNLSCDHSQFWHNLSSTYKFYFAAENSLCEEYITEKFWRTLELGMVPVAYGGANYTQVAPPNSFIDTKQFETPQELVNYLIWLSDNPLEYSKYFDWRRRFKVVLTDAWHGWCKLCEMARQYKNHTEEIPRKYYTDLRKWWVINSDEGVERSVCSKPPKYI